MLRHSLGGTYRSLKEEYLLQSHREMRIDVAHRSRYLIFTLFVSKYLMFTLFVYM